MLQWTWECTYHLKLMFLFSPDKYPEMEFLDHIVVLFLLFWGTSILFSILAAPACIPTNSAQGFPSPPQTYQHLLFLIFLIITILTGVRWHLIVVWVYISLMINMLSIFSCSRCPSVCLLWKKKYLFRSPAHV